MNESSQPSIYYFLFGYHHPDSLEAMRLDKEFDVDSTGVIPIQAESENAALEWGKQIAKWYIDQLYLGHPEATYNWSPVEYACWIETSVPEGCEECVREIGTIEAESYPDFSKLKQAMQD